MMVGLKRISTAFGLVVALASVASAQDVAVNQNQSTANAVAGTLRSSQNLAGYRIEIVAREGLVTLTGALARPRPRKPRRSLAPSTSPACAASSISLRVSNDNGVSTVRYQPSRAGLWPGIRPHNGGDVVGGYVTAARSTAA